MPTTRAARRRSLVIGAVALLFVVVFGAVSAGWSGALGFAALFVALSAGWGVVTTRTWWGPMPRGGAAAVGGVALVVLVVAASVGGAPTDEEPPAAPPSSAGPPDATVSVSAEPEGGVREVPPSDTPRPKPAKDPEPSQDPGPSAEPGTALAAVALLDVKGRAPKTGYDRDEFGPAWADVDHNGCDTRNDVLRRDLDDITTRAGTHGCVVLTGTFDDPYSGTTIGFRRGQGTSSEVQIDHVVALSDAWQKGAQQLSEEERELLANDPLNLLASDGSLNASKGDGDTATWLPPHKPFRCAYVARQVVVKRTYDLWVTAAERDAMRRVLGTCPDHRLPAGEATEPAAPLMPGTETTEEPASDTGQGSGDGQDAGTGGGAGGDGSGGDVVYENCDAVRAAGADPVHAGDPGYSRSLDRDGDGVGCE